MKNLLKVLVTLTILILTQIKSFAGATEDLWTALKGANYPNALAAIAAGADVKNLDPAFGTPLNFAACWADVEVVKALIEAKSDVNFIAPANGYNPLTNAAAWGNIDAMKLLIAAGSNVKNKDKFGQPMLASAAGSSKLEVLKILSESGADPSEKYTFAGSKDLSLLNALFVVKEPNEKVAHLKSIATTLAKMGVTFPPRITNAQESDFSTVEDLGKFLIDKGADANQKNGGWGSILGQACDLEKTGLVKALIYGKADVNYAKGEFGRTPLFYACSKGNASVLEALLAAKPDLNKLSVTSIDKHYLKLTPLMMASAMGFDACVEKLCLAGADINLISTKVEHTNEYSGGESYHVKTTFKDTALSFADANDRNSTVALLKKYGALLPKEVKR